MSEHRWNSRFDELDDAALGSLLSHIVSPPISMADRAPQYRNGYLWLLTMVEAEAQRRGGNAPREATIIELPGEDRLTRFERAALLVLLAELVTLPIGINDNAGRWLDWMLRNCCLANMARIYGEPIEEHRVVALGADEIKTMFPEE